MFLKKEQDLTKHNPLSDQLKRHYVIFFIFFILYLYVYLLYLFQK